YRSSRAERSETLPRLNLFECSISANFQAESKNTAPNPHRIPTSWRPLSDSCKRTRAAITTIIGYNEVSGTTMDALPPLFKAAKRAQDPRALNAPPRSAQHKFRGA